MDTVDFCKNVQRRSCLSRKRFPINWCPSCKTGLANEEVVNGKCERCGADVTKKNLRQWMLKDHSIRRSSVR